jgi:hypothetical protein
VIRAIALAVSFISVLAFASACNDDGSSSAGGETPTVTAVNPATAGPSPLGFSVADAVQITDALPADWIVVPQNALPAASLPQFLPVVARDKLHSIAATSFRKVNGDEILVSGGVVIGLLRQPIQVPTADQQATEIAGEGADRPELRTLETPIPSTLTWSIVRGTRVDDVIQFVVQGQIVVRADIAYEQDSPPELTAQQLADFIYQKISEQLASATAQ